MTELPASVRIEFPDELPISGAREAIATELAAHQVVIVAGATGSGKTTQLPKICLAAGRGSSGMIGHTQPRRLAARTVAERIASELGVELGGVVGYQVRFDDRSDRSSRVKLMTDGILLNAIRHDRNLRAFDTIIVDEAHERTVNIDFLLGYLKLLLRRRSDLRVIVTSATVDATAFSRYFDDAPVIDVEGRLYPVTIEYAEPDRDETLVDAVVRGCNMLAGRSVADAPEVRDMLVFLPGERAIRDVGSALEAHGPPGWEVLPLYARLNARQQQKVFAPGARPRIVLATNVAETSLTVPRIRYVIDSGLARVKRYSARHRIDTLQIEPVARASASQRAGRCGRLAPGTCLRLYAEQDFESRPAFTDPEIQRTNLAGVLLRVKSLGFGRLESFPFIDPPDPKFISDAERLLVVLGAVDERQKLTADGRLMARLPVDPRLARLLLEGRRRRCLADCLVIAAALSAGDPREAVDRNDAARSAHRREAEDRRSDFASLLAIWHRYLKARRGGSGAVRAFCNELALAEHRVREWDDVHGQLLAVVDGLGWKCGRPGADYARIHQAVLGAFVDYIAEHDDRGTYRGMHGVRSRIFPGSTVAPGTPRWIVAAEHVSTERNFLRMVARIDPRWIEEVAPHLLKRSLGEPFWDDKRGCVVAPETTSVFGLVVGTGRRVDFGPVDAARAREIFIRDGLAAGRKGFDSLEFVRRNKAQQRLVHDWEARRRSRDLYVGDRALAAAYATRLPADVMDRRSLVAWCRDPSRVKTLELDWRDLVTEDVSGNIDDDFPTVLECAGQQLRLTYRYEPGHECDGVTLDVPVVLLDSVPAGRIDWLVPGLLREKVVALLRTLPKELRRPLVPLPDTADALLPAIEGRFGVGSLTDALAEAVSGLGQPLPPGAFASKLLPAHLRMRVRLIAADGEEVAAGRDFGALQRAYGGAGSATHAGLAGPGDTRMHTAWSFGTLSERVDVKRFGTTLSLYPAIVPAGRGVRLEHLPPGPSAAALHRTGVRRLLVLALPQQTAMLRDRIRGDRELLLAYHGVGTTEALVDDILEATAEAAFEFSSDCRSAADFERILDAGRAGFVEAGEAVLRVARELLDRHRRLRRALAALDGTASEAATDMSAQLERLVYPGCLAATPPEWLAEIPRYLAAMAQRCESLRYRNTRDSQDLELARKAETRWLRYAESLPTGWPLPPAVEHYRWLTEELRVSLFAQGLGTKTPVSGKRLERYWHEQIDQL